MSLKEHLSNISVIRDELRTLGVHSNITSMDAEIEANGPFAPQATCNTCATSMSCLHCIQVAQPSLPDLLLVHE